MGPTLQPLWRLEALASRWWRCATRCMVEVEVVEVEVVVEEEVELVEMC